MCTHSGNGGTIEGDNAIICRRHNICRREQKAYLDDHPRIVPLFEIDIIETVVDYPASNMLQEEAYELDPKSLLELSRARAAFDWEMEISRRVSASTLEDVNVEMTTDPRVLSIAKDLPPSQKEEMI